MWYLDSLWEKGSDPLAMTLQKKKISLVQYVPDTVSKEQANILLYFHYAENRSLLCGFWSLLGFGFKIEQILKFVLLYGFHFCPGRVRRKSPVAEEPRALVDVLSFTDPLQLIHEFSALTGWMPRVVSD